jgi:hypothetical protein
MYDLRFKRCFHLFAPPQLPGGVPKYRNSLGHAGAMNTSNSIAPHCLLVRQHAMLWKTISTATRSPAPALLSYDCHIQIAGETRRRALEYRTFCTPSLRSCLPRSACPRALALLAPNFASWARRGTSRVLAARKRWQHRTPCAANQ